MEAILVMPSPDRARDLVRPLSLGGIVVRNVLQSGTQLVSELTRELIECIILPESLPDGPVDIWLKQVAAAVSGRRPLVVVLVYDVTLTESIRHKVQAVYDTSAEVIAAGTRNERDVAAEAVRILNDLGQRFQQQNQDAHERLQREVAPGLVPQPSRGAGAVAFAGVSGGVGTSTLVANLATYAAMAGQRVLIVDAQFGTAGSILHCLGQQPDEQNYGLHHLRWTHMGSTGGARDSDRDELMQRLEEIRIRKVMHADIRVLSVPAILQVMTQGTVEQVVWAIKALERSFDVVLLDCGTGLGHPRMQQLLESANQIYLVAAGWGSSVFALERSLTAMAGKSETDRLFLLLREVAGSDYGAKTVSSYVKMPIYGRIPEEPLLRKAQSRLGVNHPLVLESRDSAYAKSVAELAFALGLVQAAATAEPKKSSGWFRFSFGRGS